MKSISNVNFKGKTVLLRADLNSDLVKGKVLMSERIKQSAVTINELKKKKAKVVVISHQGRPGKSDFTSLKQHSKLLKKFTKVKFVNDVIGRKAIKAIKNLKPGKAILLGNVRNLKAELKFNGRNNALIKTLVPLADIYVNDAFSVCHRKHTSIIGFPKYLKSYIGRLLEKEIQALKKVKLKNTLFILGGAKQEENIRLLDGNKVLACGLFGQLCRISEGTDFGAQNKYLKDKLYIMSRLRKRLKNVEAPVDFAVKANGKRQELTLEEFPSKYEIYDIGKNTMEQFTNKIKKSKSIFMKGPAGFCADKRFCEGTTSILNAIADNKGFSLLGGGHLNDAIAHSKINPKRFNHISLSGGALIRYIVGEKLPGLEVLR